jgi:hypothetical protein
MGIIYKLLYRNTGEQVMNVLTESDAYKANMKAKEVLNNRIEQNAKDLKDQIQKTINVAINDGKFKCTCEFYSKDISKEGKEYIKNYYKEKGYKIRVGIGWIYEKRNRKFVLSWKQKKV